MTSSELPDWFQIAALGAAAVFFLAKVVAGLFIVSLTLEAKAKRTRIADDRDLLVVSAWLKSGNAAAVRLDTGQVRLTEGVGAADRDGNRAQCSPLGLDRLKVNKHWLETSSYDCSAWPGADSRHRLKPPRGEALETGCGFEVAPDTPCTLETVVTGRSWQPWHPGQWRSTLVSAPVARSPGEGAGAI